MPVLTALKKNPPVVAATPKVVGIGRQRAQAREEHKLKEAIVQMEERSRRLKKQVVRKQVLTALPPKIHKSEETADKNVLLSEFNAVYLRGFQAMEEKDGYSFHPSLDPTKDCQIDMILEEEDGSEPIIVFSHTFEKPSHVDLFVNYVKRQQTVVVEILKYDLVEKEVVDGKTPVALARAKVAGEVAVEAAYEERKANGSLTIYEQIDFEKKKLLELQKEEERLSRQQDRLETVRRTRLDIIEALEAVAQGEYLATLFTEETELEYTVEEAVMPTA